MHLSLLNISPERQFLFYSLLVGTILLLLTPPFQAPDEYNHFYRAYQLSEGTVITKQTGKHNVPMAEMPVSIIDTVRIASQGVQWKPERKIDPAEIFPLFSMPLNPEKRGLVELHTLSMYTPAPYLPHITGILFGRLIGASPLTMLYLARIASLLAWISLTYFAVRTTPIFRRVFVLIALMPMSVFLAPSISADSITNAAAFAYFALILKAAYAQSPPSKRDLILLFAFAVLLGLSKSVYVFMVFFFLLIPVRQLPSRGFFVGMFALLLGVTFGLNLLWNTATNHLRHIPNTEIRNEMSFDEKTDYMKQRVLHHPIEFTRRIVVTSLEKIAIYGESFVGGKLGWSDVYLPTVLIILYWTLIIGTAISRRDPPSPVSIPDKVLLVGISLLIIYAVFLVEYIIWTSINDTRISGVRGRYFIPVGIPLLLMLYNTKYGYRFSHKTKNIIIFSFLCITHTMTLLYILFRYYSL